MRFEPFRFPLRDGRVCELRPPVEEDGEEMLAWLRGVVSETPYLLRTPEEAARLTVEAEKRFLTGIADSPASLMAVAVVDGEIVGNCQVDFYGAQKQRHLCSVAIALSKSCWGNGIGTRMLSFLLDTARAREGVKKCELEFIGGNDRARALYEKLGFRVVGVRPGAICQGDGSLADLYLMQCEL